MKTAQIVPSAGAMLLEREYRSLARNMLARIKTGQYSTELIIPLGFLFFFKSVAIGAPLNPKQKGLMLYMLRFAEELRDPKSAFSSVTDTKVDAAELALAKQLIDGKISAFDLSAYKNEYQAAVKTLVEAKRKGKPLAAEPEPSKAKVINIMDALRSSLADNKKPKKTSGKKVLRRKRAA